MQSTVILPSRLTRDPDFRVTPTGTAVCQLGVAVDFGFGDRAEAVFVDVVTFGKTAEYANKAGQKGDFAYIRGRLKLDQWETQSGEKRSKLKVVADEINIVSQGQRTPKPSQDERYRENFERPKPKPEPTADFEQGDEDIPF